MFPLHMPAIRQLTQATENIFNLLIVLTQVTEDSLHAPVRLISLLARAAYHGSQRVAAWLHGPGPAQALAAFLSQNSTEGAHQPSTDFWGKKQTPS